MSNKLIMGQYREGGRDGTFSLSRDAQVQTFAVIGVRGSGKTVCATVMAEEMCKQGLLWTAFDPISVWWGLRAKKDGTPGGFPVLVFGGNHGDIPIQKTDGRRIAEVIAHENVFTVIDVKRESKTFWHTFMTDLSLGLMDQEPDTPRHIFVEEAPEFVPQKPQSDLSKRTKDAVERLVRLGRNQGYGCTLIGQRSATINKDVLSQCENLFALRTIGSHDYKAFVAWLESAGLEKDQIKVQLKDLAKLPDGTGHFWSPHFAGEFSKVAIRYRETFHPGETRKVGVAAKSVTLAPLKEVVARVQKRLSKTVALVPGPKALQGEGGDGSLRKVPSLKGLRHQIYRDGSLTSLIDSVEEAPPKIHPETLEELERLRRENASLKADIRRSTTAIREITAKLEGVRKSLSPQYKALHSLFSEIGKTDGQVDPAAWEEWLKKAGGRGCRRILEVMLEKQTLRAIQLATLSGISYRTLKNYRGWLKSNGLVQIEGEGEDATFTLIPLA